MLAQLESKILDLQNQIQATQAQITDYQTNRAYIDYYYTCIICGKVGKNAKPPCHKIRGVYNEYFTKTAELAQAQAQLTTLQNELKATQVQYEQAKEHYKARAMILNQAFISPPQAKTYPPKKCLKV